MWLSGSLHRSFSSYKLPKPIDQQSLEENELTPVSSPRLLKDSQIDRAAEEIAIKQWLLDNPNQLAEIYDGAKLAPYDVELLRNQIGILRKYGLSLNAY